MSEPNQEILRTAPSPAPNHTSLPSRIPAAPVRRVPPKMTPAPASRDSASGQPGPKNETARLTILPKASVSPSAALNSTHASPFPVHPVMTSGSIPRSVSWIVFGLAVLIFLIQILNYIVS